MLVLGDEIKISGLREKLKSIFKATDLGGFSQYLDIEFYFRADGNLLSQPAYVKKVFKIQI